MHEVGLQIFLHDVFVRVAGSVLVDVTQQIDVHQINFEVLLGACQMDETGVAGKMDIFLEYLAPELVFWLGNRVVVIEVVGCRHEYYFDVVYYFAGLVFHQFYEFDCFLLECSVAEVQQGFVFGRKQRSHYDQTVYSCSLPFF